MAGYHNDQYFNLVAAGEEDPGTLINRAGFQVRGADNPPFVYPDRVIRTGLSNGGQEEKVMRRGYIRSLTSYANGQSIPIKKCQFQFNPATLIQSVSANDSMLNFLQQDPAQYAQPMPGNVNFTFDLFFDRSMEINNAANVVPNIVNPWEQGDPGQVGVLRDLAAFYSVIGQGLSEYQIDYVTKVLRDTVTAEASAQATSESPLDPTNAISNIPKFLEINIANSAFLLPLPVRVVFSSLYIVEGLVTNTTVEFRKFNTDMVPMQCALNVTLEAKYIGFAKKNTFLTYVLEERTKLEIAEQKESADRLKAAYAGFASVANSMQIQATDWELIGDNTNLNNFLLTKGGVYHIDVDLPTAASQTLDSVSSLFDEGVNLNVEVQANVTVYGPYGSSVLFLGNNPTQQALRSFALTNISLLGSALPVLAGSLISSNSTHGTATTKDEWRDMVEGAKSSTLITTTAPTSYNIDTSYYIIKYAGTCQATIDGQVIVGTGEQWVRYGPGAAFLAKKTVTLHWPSYSPVEQTTSGSNASVPPDNKATSKSKPGATSKVGKPSPRTGPQ